MATTATATINGGPRGGLHTTPLLRSDEPQQDETCRVDSNSSFDSGQDDNQSAFGRPNSATPALDDLSGWSNTKSNVPYDLDNNQAFSDGNSKKRRKQSRPIRIPASELPDPNDASSSDPAKRPGTLTTCRQTRDLQSVQAAAFLAGARATFPDTLRDDNVEEEAEEDASGQRHRPEAETQFLQSMFLKGARPAGAAPLNLSSRIQGSEEENSLDDAMGKGFSSAPGSDMPASALHLTMTSPLDNNDKTELIPGQGTKDFHRNPNPSFSPGLFPLLSSTPFFNFVPTSSSSSALTSALGQQPINNNNAADSPSATNGMPTITSSSSSSFNNNNNANKTSNNNNSSIQNMPPHRIFNPEAYCDLCNKEFCNKYFLKTHKANKHGVYSDPPATSAGSLGSTSVPPISQTMLANAATLTSSSQPGPYITSSAPSGLVGPSMPISPQSQSSLTNSPQAAPAVTSAMKSSLVVDTPSLPPITMSALGLETSKTSAGSSSALPSSREAFCELCQKEFCNKYFLKRHKAKIHGIVTEASSSGGNYQRSSSSKSSSGGSSRGLSYVHGDKSQLNYIMSSSDLEDLRTDAMKMLDESRGSLEDGELRDGKYSKGRFSPMSESQQNIQQRSSVEGETDEEKIKISSQVKLPLGLPQLGLGNLSENTCQFCFREFSSKSLLRAHVNKKHRLLLPTFPPFLLPFQAIGSNLFEEPGDRNQDVDSDSLEQPEGKEDPEYTCNQCGRAFQTVYLLRMHKSYIHPDADDMSDITAAAAAAVTKMEESSDMDDSGQDTPTPQNTPDNNNEDPSKAVKVKQEDTEENGTEPMETNSETDDLRRLQTMIMELNRVSSAAAVAAAASSSWSPAAIDSNGLQRDQSPGATNNYSLQNNNGSSLCVICSKEFYSPYFLQQHIQHYHMGNNNPEDLKIESPGSANRSKEHHENSTPTSPASKSLKKETATDYSQSSFLTPGPKPGGQASSQSSGGSKNENPAKRPSPSLSRSYCTICHKELCNKYFMRTHMLKMHGISIESSTGLGGVTCDICNKELCSKYFLKVHKQNTHGIVEDGPSPPNPSTPGPVPLSLVPNPNAADLGVHMSLGTSNSNDLVPLLSSSPLDMQSRYFTHYSEVCPFCGRRFRSSKWLKTHLQTDHGQEGKDRWKAIEKALQNTPSGPSSTGNGKRIKSGNVTPANSPGAAPTNPSGATSKSASKSNASSKQQSSGGSSGMKSSTAAFPLISGGSNGNKCALCGFLTPDPEVMKVHLIKEHANQFAGMDPNNVAAFAEHQQRMLLDPLTLLFQKMEGNSSKAYRCSYCPFTTSVLVYLYAHERTHGALGLGSANQTQAGADPAFQCPMCYHSFQQVEAFQQHLIGHQMSGVLAPFFNPSAASQSALHSALTTPESQGESAESVHHHLPFSALGLFNGVVPPPGTDNFYWSLKNSRMGLEDPNQGEEDANSANEEAPSPRDEQLEEDKDDEEEATARSHKVRSRKSKESRETSGKGGSNKRRGERVMDADEEEEEEDDDDNENDETLVMSGKRLLKRAKISSFRCFYCQMAFKARPECAAHIQQNHSEEQKKRKKIKARRNNKHFRCRKCKFSSNQYRALVVHNRVHHSLIRPTSYHLPADEKKNRFRLLNWNKDDVTTATSHGEQRQQQLSEGNALSHGLPLARGIPQVSGDFQMQEFLLFCSSDEQPEDKFGALGKAAPASDSGNAETGEEPPVLDESTAGETKSADTDDSSRIQELRECKELIKSGQNNNYNDCLQSSGSGLFVPSLVYLPVREKVSQSVRVSFSLTPTS